MTTRDDYISAMKLQLDEINEQMKDIETQTKKTQHAASQAYLKDMSRLRQQAKEADTQLEDLKKSSDDAWQTMVDKADKVRHAFSPAFKDFQARV